MNDSEPGPPCFEDFLAASLRSQWIREPGLSLYVRRPLFAARHDFTLATLSADEPGSGALTRFLDKYEPQYSFHIECIHEERLMRYFWRRGYSIIRTVPGIEWDMYRSKENKV